MSLAQSYALALATWREARGESAEAKRAVAWVIRNRVSSPKGPYRNCKDVISTVLCPLQFSSFNANDVNSKKWPALNDPSWLECCEAAESTAPDPTGSATHYHSLPIGKEPAWADPTKQTAQIGAFRFYKL